MTNDAVTGDERPANDPRMHSSDPIQLPAGVYIAIDADCPNCGHPERRTRFDEHGALFSCRNCPYVSRERES